MNVKYGHNDIQYSNVSRGPPAGNGQHPKSVTYVRQRKLVKDKGCKYRSMYAHARIGGQGQKFKAGYNKEWAATSKKAQKKKRIAHKPMSKQINDSMRKEASTPQHRSNGGRTVIDLTEGQAHYMELIDLVGKEDAHRYLKEESVGIKKL